MQVLVGLALSWELRDGELGVVCYGRHANNTCRLPTRSLLMMSPCDDARWTELPVVNCRGEKELLVFDDCD